MTIRTLLERLRLLHPRPEGIEDVARACTAASGQVSRRAFLGLAGGAIAGLAVDPEQLLWMPGEKTIVIPDARDVQRIVGGSFVSPDWVTREVLRTMEGNLTMAGRINRRWNDRDYRPGDTVRMRRPRRFDVHANAPIWPPRPIHDELVTKIVDQYAVEVDYDKLQETARTRGLAGVEHEFVRPIADKLTSEVDTFVGELPLRFTDVERADVVRSDHASVRSLIYQDIPVEHEKPPRRFMRFDVQGFKAPTI
jgi:hypothetical protein